MPDLLKGFDADQDCRPALSAALDAGVSFVLRYLKNLSRAEAVAFAVAGVKVVAVWEKGGDAPLSGQPQGDADGEAARDAMSALGVPAGQNMAVYAGIDFDAQDPQIAGPIDAYFAAFGAALGPDYLLGAYGNGASMRALLARNRIARAWVWGVDQSNGTQQFLAGGGWHVHQRPTEGPEHHHNSLNLPIDYDPDLAQQDNFGGFLLAPPPPNPADVQAVRAAGDIKRDDNGPLVQAGQRLLAAKGQNVRADGSFGQHTFDAVQLFQKSLRLPVSGVIDAPTKARLTV
jgi:hypothetical protein